MKANVPEQRLADSVTFAFGDNEELCNELLSLVQSGDKTATCDAMREFGPEGGSNFG